VSTPETELLGGERTFPGARRPDRTRTVDSNGVGLSVVEWGDAEARPVLLAHGGFDFAGTYDLLGPRLADAGWRAVSWDQRGHGDSDRAALYTWDADIRDSMAVLEATSRDPMPLIGHSKGGGMMMTLAEARPDRCSAMVNLDGLPTKRAQPDVADHDRTRMLAEDLSAWLDHRRRVISLERKPGTIEELAARRARMNPRLDPEWLQYLVTIGARHDHDGWRWKLDPAMRFGGFGPWRPEWALHRMRGLAVPFLGVLGLVYEEMGWGTKPEDLDGYLPVDGRLETLADTGHFVHIERTDVVAEMIIDFLGAPA
jgi:pimeloyl-ACP methyl ester carboxylesterase